MTDELFDKPDPEWRWPNEELSCGKVGGDDDSR